MVKEMVSEYIVLPTKKKLSQKPKPSFWAILTGLFFTSSGIIILLSWPLVYKSLKNFAISMEPGSFKFSKWSTNTIPIITNVYFFNWTNPEEILDKDKKPEFQEVGPYRYIENRFKEDVVWNENDTITFKQRKFWYFDQKNSPGNLNDVVTTINAIALSAAYKVRTMNVFFVKGLSQALRTWNIKMHISKTVNEIMFEGYKDIILTMGKKIPMLPDGTVPEMDKFCWFHNRNGTTDFDGTLNIALAPTEEMGAVKNLDFSSRIPYYRDQCGDVKGSFSELFPPNLDKQDLEVFTNEICRSVPIEFEEESYRHGIKNYKYILGKKFLDNGSMYPENSCYNSGNPIPSGVFNVSACRYGTPSFISLPHFYGADSVYTKNITGLSPEKEKHEFFVKLEPETGIPLKVKARVQVNMQLQRIPSVSMFNNAPDIMMPIFWFEQIATIPDEFELMLWYLLKVPIISKCVGSAILILGVLILSLVAHKNRKSNVTHEKNRVALLS